MVGVRACEILGTYAKASMGETNANTWTARVYRYAGKLLQAKENPGSADEKLERQLHHSLADAPTSLTSIYFFFLKIEINFNILTKKINKINFELLF